MRWFADRGHPTTGVDRSEDAVQAASRHGRVLQADIEDGPWPFDGQRFGAIVVTNYLWRPRLPDVVAALAPGGVLICETFAVGNETVGRPARADFLLRPGELLDVCRDLRVVAYENGFLETPARFVQRVAAVRPGAGSASETASDPPRHLLQTLASDAVSAPRPPTGAR